MKVASGIIVPFGSAVFIGIPTIECPTIDKLLLLGGIRGGINASHACIDILKH